jgi:hypothetical protein
LTVAFWLLTSGSSPEALLPDGRTYIANIIHYDGHGAIGCCYRRRGRYLISYLSTSVVKKLGVFKDL